MKKFEDLMSVKNEIENISASQAKENSMIQMYNLLMLEIRKVLIKEQQKRNSFGQAFLEFYLAEGSPLENKFFKENPDKEYVVFCGVGGQGTLSTKTMKDMGIKNVKNITGGMAEWKKLKK